MLTNPELFRNVVNNNVQERKISISGSPNKFKLESINNEKENYTKELNDKESEVIKNEMEKQIRKLQEEMIRGGEALQEKDREIERERYKLQKQLEEQNKNQQKLIEEKRKKEEEFLTVEQNYANAQEELEHLRKKVKELQKKYNSHKHELQDIEAEHEYEKENLIDSLREVNKENDFLNQILNICLGKDEINEIRLKSKYDNIENKWVVPKFILRNKNVLFPKINNNQFNAMKDNEIQNRDLDFDIDGNNNNNNNINNNNNNYMDDKYNNNQYVNLFKDIGNKQNYTK